MAEPILINRAPVLTLWAAVTAQRMGYDRDAALTLGKCLAGLNAQSKGRMLGIFAAPKKIHGGPPKKVALGEDFWVEVCGRPVPAKNTDDGVRAVVKDNPIDPAKVQTYLESKFGEHLSAVWEAMAELARAFEPEDLDAMADELYRQFRPAIPKGRRGWGAKGELDLDFIRSLADRA